MVKSFNDFIFEALSLKRSDRGAHFKERVEQRLSNLKVVGVIPDGSESTVKIDKDTALKIEAFYRKTLTALADPNQGLIFRETEIGPTKIGLILMARPYVKMPDGTGAVPVFSVYERMARDKEIFREGSYFWMVTIGSEVATVLLHKHDGRRPDQRESLIDRSISHIISSREAELARLSRISGIDFSLKSEIKSSHEIITKTFGGNLLNLDLYSGENIETQAGRTIEQVSVKKEVQVGRLSDIMTDFELKVESAPKMLVSPRAWFMERNEKFGVWGARPIVSSKLTKGVDGNAIEIEVGDKHVYWIPNKEGVFNPPVPSSRRSIKKGDVVTLAKELGAGRFMINTGKVNEISIDSTASEYPYVKTDKWIANETVEPEEARLIFKRKGSLVENLVLGFKDWLSL